MPARELVTLQLGTYANYVGAHFWNLQDELLGSYGHDTWGPLAACMDLSCLYSEQLDKRGVATWRPRALFADLSGALGGIRPGSDGPSMGSASAQQIISSWTGGVQVHTAPRVPKSRFMEQLEMEEDIADADDEAYEAHQAALEQAAAALSAASGHQRTQAGHQGVRYWSDFLKIELTPKAVFTIPGAWHGVHEFDGYGDGLNLMPSGSEAREDLSERVRQLVEECDNLQGFQVFAEDQGGWGSITHSVMEEVHEEYCHGSRPCVLFSVRPPADVATTNTAGNLSLHQYNGLSHMRYHAKSHFETAALLASVIDTATCSVRLTRSPTPLGPALGAGDLQSLTNLLTASQRGCPLAAVAMCMPLPDLPAPTHKAQADADARVQHESATPKPTPQQQQQQKIGGNTSASTTPGALSDLGISLSCVTPGLSNDLDEVLAESYCVRGGRVGAAPAQTATTQAALDELIQRHAGVRCVRHRAVVPLPLLVPLPFPKNIWRSSVGIAGQLAVAGGSTAGERGSADVASTPVMSKLYTSRLFEARTLQVAEDWKRAAGSTSGRALLDHWQMDRASLPVIDESLRELAGLYEAHSD